MKDKLYYLISSTGQALEASDSAGYWEKDGISNLEVMKSAYGITKRRFKIGCSVCTFKVVSV